LDARLLQAEKAWAMAMAKARAETSEVRRRQALALVDFWAEEAEDLRGFLDVLLSQGALTAEDDAE